jgi:hypothetical protein
MIRFRTRLYYFLFLLTIFFSQNINAQVPILQWVKSIGGVNDDIGQSIAIDNLGNTYATGYFVGTVDFDPGPGTYNLITAGPSFPDIYVVKLDANGNLIWAKSFRGYSDDNGYSISVDAQGNVYTTGHFQGTVDFDPGPGIYNLITVTGASDVFVSKLDSLGNFIWAKNISGTLAYGHGIKVDKLGNVYTIGYFQGTVDFDPGAGLYNLISVGNSDIFISKLDSSGNFMWAKSFGSATNDYGWSIEVDKSGNIYATGSFTDTCDFNPGTGINNLISVGNSMADIFILKLDSSGSFIWVKQMGGISSENSYSMAVDTLGNIYTTGYYMGTSDFDPNFGLYNLTSAGNTDIFISKLDSSGNFIWAKSIGGSFTDDGLSLAVDILGNVYITGFFEDTCDFDPGVSIYNLVSGIGATSIFITKLDSLGNFVWAGNMGGLSLDRANSIKVDMAGNIYITGYFQGSCDFNPGIGVNTLVSAGSGDIFIQKLSQCSASTSTLSHNACSSYILNGQTYSVSGIYNQTLTNVAGCDSTLTLNLIINTVNNTVSQSGITLTAIASSAAYQWVNCPAYTLIPNATNQSYTATVDGEYAVIVTENGCTDTSVCSNISLVSVFDNESSNKINITPNPTKGIININASKSLNNASMQIVSTEGEILLQSHSLSGRSFTFDLSNYAIGIYFIEVIINGHCERLKVMKN